MRLRETLTRFWRRGIRGYRDSPALRGSHESSCKRDARSRYERSMTMPFQGNWKWCRKCQVLCFAGGAQLGACQAGGDHDHSGSGNYVLVQNEPSAPGQSNWKWCNKCQELCFAGTSHIGTCPAGGAHDHTGSGNYVIGGGQSNWKWCNKCQALAFAGNPQVGPCPNGGNHDHTGSGDYTLL
jgi:hypothetical protein